MELAIDLNLKREKQLKTKLVIFIVLVTGLFSCKKENCFDCIKSTGKIITQKRAIDAFSSVFIEDKIDVYITQDSIFKVEVEAGQNLQSLIKTDVDGETLRIHNDNKCNWVRGYKHTIKVFIHAPYFKYIENAGVGTTQALHTITQNEMTIRTSNSGDLKLAVNTNKMMISAHGNGDIYLTGNTIKLESSCVGTNFLFAKDLLISNYAFMYTASIGNSFVTAPENGLMDVQIARDGNIYYKGNPSQINLNRIGKGDLIKE
jgi:hypothetical protein